MAQRAPAESLTNIDVVTYAVALLGGLESPVHLEHIAVKAHELTPGAFRWDLDEFSTFIDKDKVRVSLTDAEKPAKGGLVKGVGTTKGGKVKRTDLWRLTAAGSEWIAAHAEHIAEATDVPAPALKKGRARELRRRVVESDLYRRYEKDGEVTYSAFEFADLLECSPDASIPVVSERFDALRGQLTLLGDVELERFLSACAQAHRRMLEI